MPAHDWPRTKQKDGWWSELPVSTSLSDSADGIKAASEYWLAQSSTSGSAQCCHLAHTRATDTPRAGSLVCLPYDNPRKFGNKAPLLQVHDRAITSFDVSRFDDLIAAGGDDGKVWQSVIAIAPSTLMQYPSQLTITPLPALDHLSDGVSESVALVMETRRAVGPLAWHSTTAGLLAAASLGEVALFDAHHSKRTHTISLPKDIWDISWSADGKLLATSSKDGIVRVYDPRSGSSAVNEAQAHNGVKAMRQAWLAGDQLLSTGLSRMRERECALWDMRNASKEVKRHRLDSNTGVLAPLVDHERNIVYLAGRVCFAVARPVMTCLVCVTVQGDMSLRWIEIGGPAIFTEGAQPRNDRRSVHTDTRAKG